MKIGILKRSEKTSTLSANSESRTAGRNRHCFLVNLNPKFILMNVCYNPMVVAKIGYNISLVASYFANLEVCFYFHS